MTAINYAPFVNRMIERYEGGYGWDANDPGGPTNYGITCYDLAEFEGLEMTSMAEWAPRVAAMTLETADEIYASKYAMACQFDALNAGPDCVVFDFDVNSGSTAIRYAQQLVGVAIDGILGPITLAAINDCDPAAFVNNLCAVRMTFLQELGTWPTFGRGWTARVSDLRSYSLALTIPKAATLPTYSNKLMRIPGASAKAYPPA